MDRLGIPSFHIHILCYVTLTRLTKSLELQHFIWSAAFNGVLNLCPLPTNMTDALDIGCGTGGKW